MTSSSRERELARQKAARQAQKEADAAARSRRNRIVGGGIVAAALIVGGGFFLANSLASPADTSASPSATGTPGANGTSVNCKEPPTLQTTAKQFPNGPEGITLTDSVFGLNVETNCGPFTIELDAKNAKKNSEALIFLANTGASVYEVPGDKTSRVIENQGYYDDTPCHRLTTQGIYVLQCGDPTGTGTGNPGFTTPDENLPTNFKPADNGRVIYPRGTVAMANNGPNTNGSQFFIVYKDSPLPPDYSVVGRVTKGLSVIDTVAKSGVIKGGTDGAPSEPIALTKVMSFETRAAAAP